MCFVTMYLQLRFSLYLFGEFNGTLAVSVETKQQGSGSGPVLLWERYGQWDDDWKDVSLDLTGLRDQ